MENKNRKHDFLSNFLFFFTSKMKQNYFLFSIMKKIYIRNKNTKQISVEAKFQHGMNLDDF